MSAVSLLASLPAGNKTITYGLIIGSVISISFYAVVCWTVKIFVRKKSGKKRLLLISMAVTVSVLKFIILGFVLWYVFKNIDINPIALVCGIAVTQIAIIIEGLTDHFKSIVK